MLVKKNNKLDQVLKEKIEAIAQDNEEKFEDVLNLYNAVKSTIKNLFPTASEVKLQNRSLNALTEHYNSEKFKKQIEQWFIPFGVFSEAKDVNGPMREGILKDFANPNKRLELIVAGKVMVMKVSDAVIDNEKTFYTDVYKPIKAGAPYKTTEVNGELVVIDGTLWNPGDSPIARDYQKQVKYGEEMYDNFSYSKPLDPSWKISLFGIGFYPGKKDVKQQDEDGEIEIVKKEKSLIEDGVICKVTWTGEHADPNSPKFILKKPIFFVPCKVKTTEVKFSNELFNSSRTRGDIEIVPVENFNLLEALEKINERVQTNAETLQGIAENVKDLPKDKEKQLKEACALYSKFVDLPYIPVIDLCDVDDYHLSHRAIRDKDGNVVKDKSGWDQTDFNSFAICECSLTGIYEKPGNPAKMIITDASLPDKVSLFPKFSNGLPKDLRPSSVLVSIQTARGNQAYDEDTKTFVVDPDNAKAIPKIKGIKVLFDFAKLDISKLKADL